MTQDASFLQQVYPGVVKAMEYEMRTTQKDPLGLFPPYVGIADDAALNGVRQMGPHIWSLHGMRHAIAMAKAMGKADDARRFEAEQQRFRAALERQLALQTAQSGGWIPPAIEKTLLGNHWDNMMLLYPEPLFEPFDPRVTATIRKSRETYAEGILGYVLPVAIGRKGKELVFNAKPGLHYWHTPDNAENALVRGSAEDQQMAVKTFTRCCCIRPPRTRPQEFSTVPWSTRDYYPSDILPDGAASGKIIELMRNMLVREYQNDLYLFSAVSPEWLKPGKKNRSRPGTHDVWSDHRRGVCRRGWLGSEALPGIPPAARARGDSRALVLRSPGGRGGRTCTDRERRKNRHWPEHARNQGERTDQVVGPRAEFRADRGGIQTRVPEALCGFSPHGNDPAVAAISPVTGSRWPSAKLTSTDTCVSADCFYHTPLQLSVFFRRRDLVRQRRRDTCEPT